MKKIQQAVPLLIAGLVVFMLAGCSAGASTGYRDTRPSVDCERLGDDVFHRLRNDDTSGTFGEQMDLLGEYCPSESEVAVDYAANSSVVFDVPSCDGLAETNRLEAVAMLYQDGYCQDLPAPVDWPNGGLGWDRARDQAGTYQRICGPLASVRNTYDGAFANVGLDYPDTGRFTFIMWGVQVDPIAPGTTVCGSGNIYLYEGGVAQIELGSPSELEIWE